MFHILFLGLLVIIPESLCTNPGAVARITEKGLNYGLEIGISVLQEKLQQLTIPSFSGTEHIPIVGSVEYSFTQIHMTSASFPSSALSLVPGSAIQVTISGAQLGLSAEWAVKFLTFFHEKGSADLSVSDLSIIANINVHTDKSGVPVLSAGSCTSQIGSLTVRFHGGHSWLYNLFDLVIEEILRYEINQFVCPLVTESINYFNPKINTFNFQTPVNAIAEAEYGLINNPIISQNYIDVDLKGEIISRTHPQKNTLVPEAFSLPDNDNSMLYLGLSEYLLNTGAQVYYDSGIFQMTVTQDTWPAGMPFSLNTNTLGILIPQVAKLYPDLPVQMQIFANKAPTVTMMANSVTMKIPFTVQVQGIKPQNTAVPIFTLNVDATFSNNIFIKGSSLYGSLSLNSINLSLAQTSVGTFKPNVLQNFMEIALSMDTLPKMNAFLSNGFPLPNIAQVNFINPQISIMQASTLLFHF
ncbi:lipopolysaccharide-binding protein-like [Erpetoichthys calabaricus]|uniref:lipopolysaccharide-binding protein-like n=1 Tax=Erpetoichthys calabaricus TaxID=27687 RepID=UPI0022344617|nr:lipopolysaccharide-binding protein-like [Erpetoichthys calabaricus]XP_051788784.1 lipopolysaccharide-binding protein-like [Erpetoichthys calabaricus]